MIDELRQRISPDVRENEPMAPMTSFKIGGPAEFFYDAKTAEDGIRAVAAAKEFGVPWFVFGGGSNMLVSDAGVKGLVIRMVNRDIRIEGTKVIVGAGAASGSVSKQATEAGLTGLEWMIGLPGTIGGAVRGNAGMFGGEVKDTLESAVVLKDGEKVPFSNADCGFSYRESVFKREPGMVVLEATFGLAGSADPATGKKMLVAHLMRKKDQQPIEYPTSGCVFVNWKPSAEGDIGSLTKTLDLDKDDAVPVTPSGAVPAAFIIDRAQLKGTKVGNVEVSGKHANFFINNGKATADDVIALIAAVKSKVRNATDGVVQLMEEVEYVGF